MSLVKKSSDPDLEELNSQIKNNISSPIVNSEPVIKKPVTAEIKKTASAEPIKTEEAAQKPKSRYSDTVNLNLPVGKRNEIKEFFNTYHLSMTQGILFAIHYLKEDVKAGKVEISKLGVERK